MWTKKKKKKKKRLPPEDPYPPLRSLTSLLVSRSAPCRCVQLGVFSVLQEVRLLSGTKLPLLLIDARSLPRPARDALCCPRALTCTPQSPKLYLLLL